MDDSYKLIWSDEFDGQEFDLDSWNIECHEPHWINSEFQEYTDNKKIVYVKDSCAVIRPQKIISSDGTASYYSGYLTTTGLKSFTYGRFEARIKIPIGRGLLPAFKLIPDTDFYGEWPCSGDIGVMEILGQEPTKVYGSVRFGSPVSQRQGCDHIYDGSYADGFHTYACEWSPNEISFFVDGEKYYSTGFWHTSDSEGNEIAPYPAPFNKPFALCLCLSIGSIWAGEPDLKTEYGDKAQMLVDYVRVYRKDEYDENVVRPVKVLNMREPAEDGNLVIPNFDKWDFELHRNGIGKCTFEEDEAIIETADFGDEIFSVQLLQWGVPLEKGKTYCLSFDACADSHRRMNVAITAPELGWEQYLPYTTVYLDKNYQTHNLYLKMNYESDDNARVEFNAGNQDSVARIKIKNVSLKEVDTYENSRKFIAVCGVWEDAENYYQFLSALQKKEITDNYVIAGVTFGSITTDYGDVKIQQKMVDYIAEMDLAAVVVFAEMLKSERLVKAIANLGHSRKVPVFAFERDVEGCINCAYEYATGFKDMMHHVIKEHNCRDIHMFAGRVDNDFSEERIGIYKQSLEEHGLVFDKKNIFYGDFWNARAEVVMQELLDNGYKVPDAIVCANDSMAIGVCDCLAKNGYVVPDDVIVTGFDGIREAKTHNPGISTCAPDYEGVVKEIIKTMGNWDESLSGVTQKKYTKYIPKFDQSCGCPSQRTEEWFDIVSRLAGDNEDYFRHVLEMGNFVSRSINMDDIDAASEELRHYLWLWTNYYYFVGLNRDPGCTHCIFEGEDGKFGYRNKYYNYKSSVPNMDRIVEKGGKYNIILAKQMKSAEESLGIIIQAYEELSLRDEQRFEEFSLYVSSVVSAVINKSKLIKAMKKIERLSESDYLTGLYNRRGFLRRVQEMIDNPVNAGRVISMFSIDMDGLKSINDNYGHNDGDCAIKVLSKSLKAYVGNRGICARYGGDEFAICIIGDRELLPDFLSIHERIRSHCASDPDLDHKPYTVDASIGISERRIREGLNLEDLISFSDTAMYIDKQSRKMK